VRAARIRLSTTGIAIGMHLERALWHATPEHRSGTEDLTTDRRSVRMRIAPRWPSRSKRNRTTSSRRDRLARGSGRLRGRGECWSRRGQCRMASRRAALVSTGTVPRGTTSRMEGPHTRKSRQRRLDVFRPPEGDRRRHEGSHTSLENAMERCCYAPTARLRLSRGHGAPLGTRRVIAFNCATMTFRSQSYAIVCPTT
jgi:hypothetical protein